ncbi:TPA: hypothetical protein ACJWWR_001480 [Streptococcus pneumoniae]
MNNNMLTNIALKAIQELALVNEQREENQRLQARVDELEALLDEQTKPADKGE